MTPRFHLRAFVLLLPGLTYLAPADQRETTLVAGVLLIALALGCGAARRVLAHHRSTPPANL